MERALLPARKGCGCAECNERRPVALQRPASRHRSAAGVIVKIQARKAAGCTRQRAHRLPANSSAPPSDLERPMGFLETAAALALGVFVAKVAFAMVRFVFVDMRSL